MAALDERTDAGPRRPDPGLAARLAAPPLRVSLPELAEQWRTTSLRLLCEPKHPVEPGVWLAHAVRGAWGNALMRRFATARTSPFPRAAAFDVFFGTHGQITSRRQIPKPYVFSVDRRGRTIELVLTLLGFADYWRPEAGQAFIEAVETGITVAEGKRFRPGWKILDAEWHRQEGLDYPASTPVLVIVFETPWRIGIRGAIGTRLGEFPMSLLERASGLARWHDCRLEADWSGWRSLSRATRFSNVALQGMTWTRRSARQGGRAIPEKGLIGRFAIDEPDDRLLPALAIGQTCHVGAESSLGLGRFTVGGMS